MTVRRRRWLRRFAIGVSIAAFAAPAAAQPDEGGAGGNGALAPQQTGTGSARRQSRSVCGRAADAGREQRRAARRQGESVRDLGRRLDGRAAVDGFECLMGWGGHIRPRRTRARPGTRTRDQLHPPAEDGRTLVRGGSRTVRWSGKRVVKARFRPVGRAFGLACVEPLLEEDAELLAGREHILVTRAARRQLHDPHVVVPDAVAAGVRGSFVQLRQCEATGQKAHVWDLSWRLRR